MTQVIEIDTGLIDAEQNNREDFSHVPGLADSIRTRGQDQPITVVRKENGRYLLIAGESRTRACGLLGIPVKAIVREDLTAAGGYMLTLAENDARQETNDLEKAKGYKRAIDEHGYTVAEIARHTGKRPDYIERRLNLLLLREDVQKLVKDGQLGISYANVMIGLDVNRQMIAMREFNANPSPTVKWFAAVCGELLQQQQQQGLFGWGYGDTPGDSGKVTAVKMPLDPAGYRPSFNPGDMRGSVTAELERWQAAGEGWRQYGKSNKVEACTAIVATLAALLAVLPVGAGAASLPVLQVADSGTAGRVVRLLAKNGEMTRRDLLQLGNMTGEELTQALAQLRDEGKVNGRKAGRGQRWALVAS